MTTAGILKEPTSENRVSLTPESAAALAKMGLTVTVEQGAGERAFYNDFLYSNVGVKSASREEVLMTSDLIFQINQPSSADLDKLKPGAVLVSMINPLANNAYVSELLNKKITCLSLDSVPRITRAQAMDVLSSMATSAGYRAVLIAATHLPHFFPLLMTAAGSITPAKVLILGAGVAGLQAVATTRKLGGVVEVFDVRAAVKEEVMSLGGKFVEVEGAKDDKAAGGYAVEQSEEFQQRQKQTIHNHAAKSDVIIATAQIPGRRAPILITKEMVLAMKPGSVIVDLAASTGGNCELTENNKTVVHNGVTIIGDSNLASGLAADSSKMFGKNIINLMKIMITKEGNIDLNLQDDILKGTVITHNGEVINERVKGIMQSTVN